MNIRNRIEARGENLEKIGFILIFLFALLSIFTSGEIVLFAVLNALGLVAVWLVYMFSGKWDVAKATLLFLLSYPLIRLGILTGWYSIAKIQYVFFAAFLIYGIYILIDSVRRSVSARSFELLAFLMGFFILIGPAAILFGDELLDKAGLYYFFALAFVLATIMYNDNLWLRYGINDRSMIKYLFAIALLTIMDSSLSSIL